MTKNKDLFYRDPTETKIPNDGVAKVARPETEQQWRVLEWELKSFVCEGEYERGLERILDSFLKNLGQSQQPAAWVSGFYGSGKSHLCRVLEYLWRDVELPSGETARSLVSVPIDIEAHLRELSTAGRRLGGLWSAAGTLGAGRSQAVRLAFLSVIFESAGLPEQYPLARFVLWSHDNDYFDALHEAVEEAGKEFEREISNLYVSPVIAEALLEIDGSLGDSVKDVRDLLKTQFPPQTEDVTDDEMFEALEDVLRLQSDTPDKYPLTLIVLDEMQQYLGDDNKKTLAVQNIVEGVTSKFDNSVLFVATGQYAMGGTPTLQKLTDRFPVQIQLSDKDVETVVRQVILRKKPDRREELKSALQEVSGEIDRHLGGTKIEPKSADKQDLVADYPILPTRRRFWELALRALDRPGKSGVLRTQLRTIHEATREVATEPLGYVVGGDFIYDQQAPALQQSGVLLKEIDELIRGLRDQGPDGQLKSRICALIFIINQIPEQMGTQGQTGLRATEKFIADLLVEDLKNDGSTLRKRVPELLEELVTAGRVMRLDDEYRLQTEEGAEWEKEYRARLAAIRDDPSKLATHRNERLVEAVDAALGGLKLMHGDSNTPRKIDPHWGDDRPLGEEADVPVWIRDEWTVTESTVKTAAREDGEESPVVNVLLPKRNAEAIKDALASHAAAKETIQSKPMPQTEEGKEAQRAMKGRVESEADRLRSLFEDVVANARVFQGGGNEVSGTTLRDAVQTAAERSLVRLFPKFGAADDPNWGKVVTKARDGDPDALSAVGHPGDVATHPVCKEIRSAISASGTDGSDLLRRYSDPPYGWPTDAIRGAVMALFSSHHIRATQDGMPLSGPKELEPRRLGSTTFYLEDDPPTKQQRLAVRGLLTAAGIEYENDKEETQISALLQRLLDLADDAGGPPPLPERPDTSHIEELRSLAGNQQFREVADAQEQLKRDLQEWSQAAQQREHRHDEWSELTRLLSHAESLSVAPEVRGQYEAIETGRQLLDEPDPLEPLIDDLSDSLRDEVKNRAQALVEAHERAIDALEENDLWSQLEPHTRERILAEVDLGTAAVPDVSTDDKLLRVLDETSLRSWDERLNFVGARVEQALQRAARELEPESVPVSISTTTIETQEDLDAYLDEVRSKVVPHLEAGKIVVI